MTCRKSVLCIFVFALLFPCAASRAAADPVIAIDILLQPDETLTAYARADNARLLENYPEGFALDATHAPHISVFQCYVRQEDLEKVFAVVEETAQAYRSGIKPLMATGYYSMPWGGLELGGITVERSPWLLEYQKAVIEAVRPFIRDKGTAGAFVPNENGVPIDSTTLDDVENYIPRHTGDRYRPHVTIGLAHKTLFHDRMAAPFEPFKFSIQKAAVYHLGNFGTARKKLWSAAFGNEEAVS